MSVAAAGWLVASYLVGAIPTSHLVSRTFAKIDLRQHGSGNLGATNLYRVLGWKYAIPVGLFDIAKGAIPVLVFAPRVSGSELYALACATCHMPDGSGVPGLQPALMGSKVVAGPPATVIKVLLLGPEKALPAHKAVSGNQMPQFDSLSDEEIASILTYVRKTFGKGASAVTPAQVKAQRPK